MRILFLTDTHLKGVNPMYRTGNFFGHIERKLEEAVFLARKNSVDVIIHGGDLFDAPLISLNLCDEIVDLMEKAGIPWNIVRGNHDDIVHNPAMSGQTILNHIFRRSPLVQHLDTIETEKVMVHGYDYYHGIEDDLKKDGLFHNLKDGKKHIAVIHAFVTKEPFNPKVMHVIIEQIKSDFDLVLLGHYHGEFGVVQHDRTTFVSIGALARMSVAKLDVERMPNVLFIDTENSILRVIPLLEAEPAEKVFDLSAVSDKQDFSRTIEDFINSLESTKFQGLNLLGVIEELGKSQDCDREVIDEIVKRVEQYSVEERK
jgi:DNA repair exonuclease SbcCD nuclease subunit